MTQIKLHFKTKLDKLWSSATKGPVLFNNSIKRGYAIEEDIQDKSLLFISMNPSFSPGAWNNGNDGGNVFYGIPEEDAPQKETNDFFVAIRKLYREINVPNKPPLAHHDLLFIRETSQKNVQTWRKDKNLTTFFDGQLDISKEIIVDSQPKLIVFLNAGARELFEEKFDERDKKPFSEKLGAYMYRLNGKETPVLFSGMLSGQRALDKGSRTSLKWHIEHILKNLP